MIMNKPSPVLSVADTLDVYSGRPGCMCGCNGEYNNSERARKMAITSLLKNPNVRLHSWTPFGDSLDAGCIFVETKTRKRVLYLTASGVEKVRGLIPEVL